MNMLCVTGITVVQVNERDYCFALENKLDEVPVWDDNKGQDHVGTTFVTEIIKGHRFCNIHGESVYIGQAKHVQQALGLPFSAFHDMQASNFNQRMAIMGHRHHIADLLGMTWWQRLRFLLTKRTP